MYQYKTMVAIERYILIDFRPKNVKLLETMVLIEHWTVYQGPYSRAQVYRYTAAVQPLSVLNRALHTEREYNCSDWIMRDRVTHYIK
jgi:hypothetical protein